MLKGTVKWFNDKKGYGFIIGEDSKEYFVHYSKIISDNSYKTLKEGQNVIFTDVVEDEKGLMAVNVTVVE